MNAQYAPLRWNGSMVHHAQLTTRTRGRRASAMVEAPTAALLIGATAAR